MAPGVIEDHVSNGDATVVPPSDEATNGTPEKKLAAAATSNNSTDAAATNATSETAPSAAAATNGTTEKATSTTLTPSTNGHPHVPEGEHQRCCCCCQLRSKGVAEDKTESKDEKPKDAEKKDSGDDDKKDKKDSDGDEKKEAEDETMKCEIKHLDRKFDDKDERYFVEASWPSSSTPPFGRTANCLPTAQGRHRKTGAEGLVATVRLLRRATL